MQLTKGTETINYPCSQWVDSDGNVYPWPQLAFLTKRGFVVVPSAAPAIPTITESKASVKAIRDNMLRGYSDKLVIYQPNYEAAAAIIAGSGDTHLVPSGATANQFATANAAAMGMPSAAYWAGYIVGEWQRLGGVVDAMEREYLRLTYHPTTGLSTMTDAAAATAAAEYVATYGG